MAKPLRVLIIEDSEDDTELLLRELARFGYETSHERVESARATKAALETQDWDLVIADYSLAGFTAPDALSIVHELGKDLPFIIVSGTIGEEAAVDALKAGAQDFLLKNKLARLQPAIERELREAELRREHAAERKRAEMERQRLLSELREAVDVRDAFIAIASHELRTPLTSMQLRLQLLRKRDVSLRGGAELATTLAVLSRQVTRLRTLISNLFDVACITTGQLQLSRELVALGDVVAAVLAQLEQWILQSGSTVTCELDDVVGSWDRERIEMACLNLVSNAVKFGGGGPIDISVVRRGESARLSVRDHGIGIAPADQSRLFNKFERAVPEQHYGGFGLGLWIVRNIAEAHGGTISVRSRPGSGSSFTLEIPLQPASARS